MAKMNVRAYFYMSTLPSINYSASLSWLTGFYDMGDGSKVKYSKILKEGYKITSFYEV
jgi:hypothetical protein